MGFVLSKVLWVFFSPGNFIIFLALLGGFLCIAHGAQWQRRGRILSFFVALLLFFVGILPVGSWALMPLENSFAGERPAHVDGILLLGGDEHPHLTQERHQPTELDSARRYIEFAALAREYPTAKLVYTGGSGRLVSEATIQDYEVARSALVELGVPVDRMTFESRSRNTHENAVMSAALVHPTPQQNWLLVTSAFHMPRSMGCFRKAGWNVFATPTGYATDGTFSLKPKFDLAEHLMQLTWAFHEYYGLVAYWLLGYIDSPWPN